MQQNFNSKSATSFADFAKRSKSLNKITDQSSILYTANDLPSATTKPKFSESNAPNFSNHSKRLISTKSSRPGTAQANQGSPQKIPLPPSRSVSPFGPGSPSASIKSVQAISPRKVVTKVADTIVYDAIKNQNKQFFHRTSTENPLYVPISEIVKKQQQTTGADISLQLSSARDQINTTSRYHQKAVLTEASPRKKLAFQPRTYNVRAMRLKETLLNPTNASIKLLERNDSKEVASASVTRRVKKDEKMPIKEENTPAQIAAQKKLEEERRFIDSIGKASYDRFYMNISLYNKYYAAYLQEPEVHFTGTADLGVTLRPKRQESDKSSQNQDKPDKKKLSVKKYAVKTYGPFKPKDNVIENRTSQVIRASLLKYGDNRQKKGTPSGTKRVVDWGELFKNDGEEKETDENEWLLFGKEMAGVQTNLKNLERMNTLVTNKGELTEEEQTFFRLVKEGREREVERMLRMNSDLVKIKDIGNKTPLHWAMQRHYVNIVGELYSHGADLDEVDMAGRKPLDLVHGVHKKEIINILEQKHWRLRRKTATFG